MSVEERVSVKELYYLWKRNYWWGNDQDKMDWKKPTENSCSPFFLLEELEGSSWNLQTSWKRKNNFSHKVCLVYRASQHWMLWMIKGKWRNYSRKEISFGYIGKSLSHTSGAWEAVLVKDHCEFVVWHSFISVHCWPQLEPGCSEGSALAQRLAAFIGLWSDQWKCHCHLTQHKQITHSCPPPCQSPDSSAIILGDTKTTRSK